MSAPSSASDPPKPRVLVTRARGQSSALADRLQELGAEPILVPALEIAAPHSYAALDDALQRLLSPGVEPTFDWLLFTSANAVESFATRADELGMRAAQRFASQKDERLPLPLRVAAIGLATAKAVYAAGLLAPGSPLLTPPQAVAESFAAALLPYVRSADGTPARFLLVRAEAAREFLPDALRAAGAQVTVAAAYRNAIPEASVSTLRELFGSSAGVDAITFTSSSSVHHLLALCEAAEVEMPASALRVSIGPITSATLRDQGLPEDAEAPQATVLSLAETTVTTLSRRSLR